MIRTAQDLMDIVHARGFRVRVDPGPPPMPFLVIDHGRREDATPVLLDALRAWRVEIIEIVTGSDASEQGKLPR